MNPLTVNTEDNGGGFSLTSTGAGLADSFTRDLGNTLHNTAGFGPGFGAGAVDALTLNADSIVNINATGQTATTAGEVFGASIGNDALTLQQGTAPETIYTGGGQDTITLFAGHTAGDRVKFYAGFNTPGVTPGGIEIPRDSSGSITQGNDAAVGGWWGIGTGGTETGYGAGGPTPVWLPTRARAPTCPCYFNAGADSLNFAASTGPGHGAVWGAGGTNGVGGPVLGLVEGDSKTLRRCCWWHRRHDPTS